MAETNKLSVEKALEKLRRDDPLQTASEQRDEKAEALRREIKRMRAQRSRLERPPGDSE
ncbi:hypothetical protein KUL72_18815 [Bradyrhizobium arachidis]|uniref:hypothetical protein n=1 Tax=Bradyrhizobium TaxID=374 RepID=UPI00188D277A|nr:MULTISPECIES: hypothetical protein [Bradyrhizobium]MDN4982030.1 hypothetical protein [Bradyrhizobium sp. WYCCWR 13022]UVO40268.1 hypothetical protein KUL72_18815 [Bradyrhizobium arachidis]